MNWEAKIIFHNNQKRIGVYFEKNFELIKKIKQFKGATWSASKKVWHLPYCMEYLLHFNLEEKLELSSSNYSILSPENQINLKQFIETLQLKGYSPNTIRTYQNELMQFLVALKNIGANSCCETKIRSYMLYCINVLNLSENTLHSRMNALKFFYEKVKHNPKMFLEIPRPKKHKKLPKVLHSEDLKKIFETTPNIKHNTILKLSYGMGLRVSEIINLKITDIDSKNKQVFIERGKGKKDRYVNLPESILFQLREYYKEYYPKIYLFEGQYGGKYSTRSAQAIFHEAMQRANINKSLSFHSLRHSYATHLLENGTDIRFIKELLGHNDIKTTLLYTNVSENSIKRIKSPLDTL